MDRRSFFFSSLFDGEFKYPAGGYTADHDATRNTRHALVKILLSVQRRRARPGE